MNEMKNVAQFGFCSVSFSVDVISRGKYNRNSAPVNLNEIDRNPNKNATKYEKKIVDQTYKKKMKQKQNDNNNLLSFCLSLFLFFSFIEIFPFSVFSSFSFQCMNFEYTYVTNIIVFI